MAEKVDYQYKLRRGGRAGAHAFVNKQERRLAALHMYYDRMHGARMKDLEAKYNLTWPVISKMLKEVMSDDIVKKLEQQILEDVVPMAINVYKAKLSEGSEFVAKDVLQNFAKIADRNIKREEIKKRESEDEDSLEFLMRLKGKIKPQQFIKQAEGEVIDGTVITVSEPAAIEAAIQETVEETVRGDLQGVSGVEPERAQILGKTGNGSFSARARSVNGGHFTSIRDILRGKVEDKIKEDYKDE